MKKTNPEVVKNYAGSLAFSMEAKHALAQMAVTGCFNNTYYSSAKDQLDSVLTLVRQTDPEFVGKLAIYSRVSAFMKDMPAALVAWLSSESPQTFKVVFPRVITNGKMLRNFVQMIRSGSFGRHNVSASVIRRAIQGWFDSKTDEQIFFQSVGSNPSLGDVLKLARVKPRTRHRSALFAYFLGKETCKFEGVSYGVKSNLPPIVSNYENYLKGSNTDLPKAPFEMLTGLSLSSQQWMQVAKVSTWTQLFKSLNTFNRHGVFNDPALTSSLAGKLSNPEVISEAQVFPYQLMSAIKATSPGEISGLPPEMSLALDSALETSLANVPSFEGKNVVICPDVSGSMSSSCTGVRKGSTSVVRAIDVAALVSAALLKKNPHNTVVLPFEGSVVNLKVSPNDSLVETTRKLASIGGGSTNCAAPIQLLNKSEAKVDVLIFISDYEANAAFSMEPDPFSRVLPRSTLMSQEWATLKSKNPGAKLVCIDVTPHGTLQVEDNPDVLHIGGFSDSVFQTMERFVSKGDKVKWVDLIEQIKL